MIRGGRPLRVQVAETSQVLHAAGWVANHDGNVTARDGVRFIATPTATSKRLVGEREIIEVDGKGAVISSGRAFGELGLHLCVYERRPDINAVIHAHPPNATAIASARGNLIDRPFIAEAVVSIGPRIPKVPFAMPGEPAKQALAPWCELVDAVLLGNHGVLAWGADLEQALMRLELVEHLARIAIAAQAIGGVEPLPADAFAPLMAARAKANLGRAADRAVETMGTLLDSPTSVATAKPVVACAPAPHSLVPTIAPGGPSRRDAASTPDIAAVVREEILRAMSSK